MQKLLVASAISLGIFLAGCHDSSKDKMAEKSFKERNRREVISGRYDSGARVTGKSLNSDGQLVEGVPLVKNDVQAAPTKLKPRHRDIEISSKYTRCTKSGSSSCLLIRRVGQEKWRASSRKIEGFSYEQGYHYLVRVKETKDENNRIHWKLVKIIHKKKNK